jgi:hypothetical protein
MNGHARGRETAMLIRVLFVALLFAAAQASAQDTILGVLEDVPGTYAGEPNSRAVRALFHETGGDWQPFPNTCTDEDCLKKITSKYPGEVTWTITFDGRKLGQVTARTPKDFKFYSHVGLQEITSTGEVSTIGKRSAEYGGFVGATVYRPLVANSQPYFKDPDLWKPSQLPANLVQQLRLQFRRKFPKVSTCTGPDGSGDAKPWAYHDEDIKLVKAYTAKTQWSVARIRLEKDRCDGPPDDPFVDQWFAISPAREIKFLDSGMWLVDAGDYDNRSKSVLVFAIDRYNEGGYELFYDDFQKRAVFGFSYH